MVNALEDYEDHDDYDDEWECTMCRLAVTSQEPHRYIRVPIELDLFGSRRYRHSTFLSSLVGLCRDVAVTISSFAPVRCFSNFRAISCGLSARGRKSRLATTWPVSP